MTAGWSAWEPQTLPVTCEAPRNVGVPRALVLAGTVELGVRQPPLPPSPVEGQRGDTQVRLLGHKVLEWASPTGAWWKSRWHGSSNPV